MTSGPFYYVQCISGNPDHIKEVVPGGELEAKCKGRAEAGYFDAFRLGYDECPDCVEDSRERAQRDANYVSLFGCPMADLDDKCGENCSCKNPKEITDSPYADQVRYITAAA